MRCFSEVSKHFRAAKTKPSVLKRTIVMKLVNIRVCYPGNGVIVINPISLLFKTYTVHMRNILGVRKSCWLYARARKMQISLKVERAYQSLHVVKLLTRL